MLIAKLRALLQGGVAESPEEEALVNWLREMELRAVQAEAERDHAVQQLQVVEKELIEKMTRDTNDLREKLDAALEAMSEQGKQMKEQKKQFADERATFWEELEAARMVKVKPPKEPKDADPNVLVMTVEDTDGARSVPQSTVQACSQPEASSEKDTAVDNQAAKVLRVEAFMSIPKGCSAEAPAAKRVPFTMVERPLAPEMPRLGGSYNVPAKLSTSVNVPPAVSSQSPLPTVSPRLEKSMTPRVLTAGQVMADIGRQGSGTYPPTQYVQGSNEKGVKMHVVVMPPEPSGIATPALPAASPIVVGTQCRSPPAAVSRDPSPALSRREAFIAALPSASTAPPPCQMSSPSLLSSCKSSDATLRVDISPAVAAYINSNGLSTPVLRRTIHGTCSDSRVFHVQQVHPAMVHRELPSHAEEVSRVPLQGLASSPQKLQRR
jgi:hypothetical protein